MFIRKHSLKKRSLIKEVFKDGQYLKINQICFKYKKNEVSTSRFVISASKKVLRKAVHRNRFKRLVRENLNKNEDLKKIGLDCAIFASKNADKVILEYNEISKCVSDFKNFILNELAS